MRRVLALAAILFATAPMTEASDPVAAEDYTLDILAEDGSCRVKWAHAGKSGSLDTGLEAPCSFNRNADGSPRVVNTKSGPVVMVEHSVPSPDLDLSCRTSLRGIVLGPGEPSLSPVTGTAAACLPAQWDEKMFIGLFER